MRNKNKTFWLNIPFSPNQREIYNYWLNYLKYLIYCYAFNYVLRTITHLYVYTERTGL